MYQINLFWIRKYLDGSLKIKMFFKKYLHDKNAVSMSFRGRRKTINAICTCIKIQLS